MSKMARMFWKKAHQSQSIQNKTQFRAKTPNFFHTQFTTQRKQSQKNGKSRLTWNFLQIKVSLKVYLQRFLMEIIKVKISCET